MNWRETEVMAEAAAVAAFGVPAVYRTGQQSASVTVIYTASAPRYINGVMMEVPKLAVDAQQMSAAGMEPAQGDRIEFGSEVWEVDFAQRAGNGARWDIFPRRVLP